MAQLFPQWLPESIKKDPGKRAEILVYEKLAKQLTDKWLVFYGAAIKWKDSYGVHDGETEFVVAHPNLGVLFIEVKGGSITREGNSWYTTWLSELGKPIEQRIRNPLSKNPYTQVTDSAKKYKRKVQGILKQKGISTINFEFATAVCFPDIEISNKEFLGTDALRELTLDRNDLDNLQVRLYEILNSYKGQNGIPPAQNELDVLKQILARDWEFDSFLGYQIEDVEKKRRDLTEEQFHLLYDIQDNPKMLIRGCAGSGKTLLAAKKANQLASQGQKVLLTCFNENLAKWLRSSVFNHSNIRISHFHEFCSQEGKNSKDAYLPPSASLAGVDEDTYFKKIMPDALEVAAIENNINFDAIIVDEGQDFETSWLDVLQGLVKDKSNGTFYIFYDDNQRIYNHANIPYSWPKHRLSRNMRNTDQIFEYVQKYYHQPDSIISSGLLGPEPRHVNLQDYTSECEAVQDVISILQQQKISLANIAILTPRCKDDSAWSKPEMRKGKYKFVWNLETFKNEIACCSIYSFKGLEKHVILLTELGYINSSIADELLYVGISRARCYLIFFGNLPKERK